MAPAHGGASGSRDPAPDASVGHRFGPGPESAADKEARSKAEDEEEFAKYLNWLAKLRAPATRVEYKERPDGASAYVVHFSEMVHDIMDLRNPQKMSMQFQITGRHGFC